MPARFYYKLLFRVLVCFVVTAILVVAFLGWRSRSALDRNAESRIRNSILIRCLLTIALLLVGYATFYIQFRLSFVTVAAYHVLDINPPYVWWLNVFFWGSFVCSATWVVSVGVTVIEFRRRGRPRRIIAYIAAPLFVCTLDWLLWEFYLRLLP